MNRTRLVGVSLLGGIIGVVLVRFVFLDLTEEIGWEMFWTGLLNGQLMDFETVLHSSTFAKCLIGLLIGGAATALAMHFGMRSQSTEVQHAPNDLMGGSHEGRGGKARETAPRPGIESSGTPPLTPPALVTTTQPDRICHQCDRRMPSHAPFCGYCGSGLTSPIPGATQAVACRRCHQDVPPESIYCGHCGHSLGPDTEESVRLLCPFCRQSVMAGSVFCGYCGSALEGGEQKSGQYQRWIAQIGNEVAPPASDCANGVAVKSAVKSVPSTSRQRTYFVVSMLAVAVVGTAVWLWLSPRWTRSKQDVALRVTSISGTQLEQQGSASMPPAQTTPVPSRCDATTQEQHVPLWNGYSLHLSPTQNLPYSGCQADVVASSGNTVWSETSAMFNVVPVTGQDINRDGTPELVLAAFSGGAHCCWTYYIVTLVTTPQVVALENRTGVGFERDSQGRYVLHTGDGSFDYFDDLSHAGTVFPDLFLQLDGSVFRDVSSGHWPTFQQRIDNARERVMPESLARFRASNGREFDQMETKAAVLEIVLEYLYGGKPQQAWREFESMWPQSDQGRMRQLIQATRAKGILGQVGALGGVANTSSTPDAMGNVQSQAAVPNPSAAPLPNSPVSPQAVIGSALIDCGSLSFINAWERPDGGNSVEVLLCRTHVEVLSENSGGRFPVRIRTPSGKEGFVARPFVARSRISQSANTALAPLQEFASVAKPERVGVSQEVSQGLLINQVRPTYPPLARQARIQGPVVLHAVIAKDGSIQRLNVVSGHPMLAPAAVEAVRQWRYKPYLVKGEPVDVETQITVNFTLTG